MNSKEFIEYIKSCDVINWRYKEKERINYYINSVKEIEKINKELYGNIGPPYFRKIMLPDDYIIILRELRAARIRMFYKLRNEKIKYLKKLELSIEEYEKILNNFEKEVAKKLKLKLYIDRKGKIKFK